MASSRLAAVGLFVLLGLALALATVVVFGRLDLFGDTRAAEIVFDGSVNGLGVGSPVLFRGVRVGAVSSLAIVFDPDTHQARIPVKIRMEASKVMLPKRLREQTPTISQWVTEGLRAEVVPVSLIADGSEIELDFDPAVPVRLHPGIADLPEIPVKHSQGEIAQQLSQVPLKDLADSALSTLQSVRRLADAFNSSLPVVVNNAVSTSAKAGQALDTARLAIENLQTRSDRTLSGIDRLSDTANRQLNDRGADLHGLLASSNEAFANARDLLGNLRTMTDEGSPDRANLDAALSDLSAAAASLRGFAGDIEQNPRLLLTGRRQ